MSTAPTREPARATSTPNAPLRVSEDTRPVAAPDEVVAEDVVDVEDVCDVEDEDDA